MWYISSHQDYPFHPGLKCLVECSRHALAKIPAPLGAERDIRSEPPLYEMLIAALVTNHNGNGAIPLEFPGPREGMLGHSPLEPCGSIRPQGGNEAGLGLSGLGIPGEDNEALMSRVGIKGHVGSCC